MRTVQGRLWGRFMAAALILIFCNSAGSADAKREAQLAERLIGRIQAGEPVWLQGSDKFLALHHAALGALPRRAVLLVHNMGGHPDWPEVIAPLRQRLPDRNWGTLSLQMPLLAPRALADDYGRTLPAASRRIRAGIEFLREHNYACVVLLGYGFGASQALAYLAERDGADGLITVGVLAREFLQPAIDVPNLLARLDIPVLDVYGRLDFPEVSDKAHDRRMAVLESGTGSYDQRIIEGADHYFTGQQQQLVKVITEWLNTTYGEHACNMNSPAGGSDSESGQATN